MTEIDKLRAALKWALENGVSYSPPYKFPDGRVLGDSFKDYGCGCCAGNIDIPKEFDDVVRAAVGKSDG